MTRLECISQWILDSAMDLSPELQEEAEKVASRQGLSLEQFVLQAVIEKINSIKAQVDLLVDQR